MQNAYLPDILHQWGTKHRQREQVDKIGTTGIKKKRLCDDHMSIREEGVKSPTNSKNRQQKRKSKLRSVLRKTQTTRISTKVH